MVKKAKSLGMSACGLTDHGTFAGAIEFLRCCRKEGIRPILGMEAYLSRSHKAKSREDQPDGRKGNRHINLIAKNFKGFQNICSLSQHASLEGFYYDPRLDLELLEKYSEGVIATSACLSNIVNSLLLSDKYKEAKQAAGIFKEIYGDDFYLEMMFHGIDNEGRILADIRRLADDVGVKAIITNDCHYLEKEDAEFHGIVMCISSGKCLKDPKRIRFPYEEFYFKSKEEMFQVFGRHVRVEMNNTLEIAEKCDYSEIIFVEEGGTMLLPKFEIEDGKTSYERIYDLAWAGLKRLNLDKSQPHIDRLKTELSDTKLIWDTKSYDFATYFLIVEDMMSFAKKKGIDSGVRGSAYGSLLLKCIGIVEGPIDPLEFDLMWERFLGFDNSYFLSESDFGISDDRKSKMSIPQDGI